MSQKKKVVLLRCGNSNSLYHIQNFYNIVSNKIIIAENINHLESKRVENSVFSREIGGENGIFSKKRRSGDFGIFSNSTV